jgi:hypothetical protein
MHHLVLIYQNSISGCQRNSDSIRPEPAIEIAKSLKRIIIWSRFQQLARISKRPSVVAIEHGKGVDINADVLEVNNSPI